MPYDLCPDSDSRVEVMKRMASGTGSKHLDDLRVLQQVLNSIRVIIASNGGVVSGQEPS